MKVALCADAKDVSKKTNLFPYGCSSYISSVSRVGPELETFKLSIFKRSQCETNPNVLQLIPYVVIRHKESGAYLTYTRGVGGDEAGLHSKRSVGLGGHIDVAPTTKLSSLIIDEAARELEEEIGLPPATTLPLLENAIDKAYYLFTNADDVSKVHLGIAIVIELDELDIRSAELDTITELHWVTSKVLLADPDILELWSKIILDTLHPVFNERLSPVDLAYFIEHYKYLHNG